MLEKIKFQKIGGGDGDEEKENIQPIGGFSKSAVYRIKEYGNEKQTKRNPDELHPPKVGKFTAEKAVLKKRKKERGEEKQFHVLPSGFVDGGNRSEGRAFCPIEKKMQ